MKRRVWGEGWEIVPTQLQSWSPAPSHQASHLEKFQLESSQRCRGRGEKEKRQEGKEEERTDSAAWPVIGGLDCAG